jgi:hypothetical protein
VDDDDKYYRNDVSRSLVSSGVQIAVAEVKPEEQQSEGIDGGGGMQANGQKRSNEERIRKIT